MVVVIGMVPLLVIIPLHGGLLHSLLFVSLISSLTYMSYKSTQFVLSTFSRRNTFVDSQRRTNKAKTLRY